jgi:hypothetical protein
VRIGVERSAGRECSAAGAGGCAGGLWRGGGVMMVRSKQPMERTIYSGRPRAGQQRRPQVSRAYLANCGCEKRYSVGREPASSAACLYVRVGTRVVMYVFVCTYKHVVDPRRCICMLLLQVTYYVCIGFFFFDRCMYMLLLQVTYYALLVVFLKRMLVVFLSSHRR